MFWSFDANAQFNFIAQQLCHMAADFDDNRAKTMTVLCEMMHQHKNKTKQTNDKQQIEFATIYTR